MDENNREEDEEDKVLKEKRILRF